MKSLYFYCAIIFLLASCTPRKAVFVRSFEMPFPKAYASVSDFNNSLSQKEEVKLNRIIANFESDSPVQIYVVLMDALPFVKHEKSNRFFNVDEYAHTLMKQWQDDAFDKEKSLLIINFIDEKEMYIAVSRDLKTEIPKEKSQKWTDELFTPAYEEVGLYKGLKKGLKEIIKVLSQ